MPPDRWAAGPLYRVPWGELALLAGVAVALHLVGIGESLWLDELFTAWVAFGTDGTLSERAALGNAVPPFYWLVQLSVAAFGPSEWAIRLPSVAFGALVPAAVYLLARALTGSAWAGRVAGLLTALDGLCGAYGAEARPYALVQFFGAVQILAFWALLAGAGWRWRVCYVAATVALGYTQFTALALVAGELAFYALLLLRRERMNYPPLRFACDLIGSGLFLLPLVPLVLTVSDRRDNFWLGARMVNLEDLAMHHRQPVYLFLPAVVAIVVAFARGGWNRSSADSSPNAAPVAFLVTVFYGTALPLWVLHRAGSSPLFTLRYTTILLLLPMVGAGLCAVRSADRWVGIAFAVTALLLGQVTEGAARRLLEPDQSLRLRSEDWRGAIGVVNAHGGRAPVFIGAGLIETDKYLTSDNPLAREYLLLPVRTVYPLDPYDRPVHSLTYSGDLPTGAEFDLFSKTGEVWIILKGNESNANLAGARMIDRLARAGTPVVIADRTVLRNVVVFRLKRAGVEPPKK
jgi:hypothetical protein